MKTFFCILASSVFVFSSIKISAQVIPDHRRFDWSKAGYEGTIPEPKLIINVKNFGAYGDGVHNDYNSIMKAINSSSKLRVIFFPKGLYLIRSTLKLPSNTVLRGEGVVSRLKFDLSSSTNKNCIEVVAGKQPRFVSAISGYSKGSHVVTVSNSSGFVAGEFVEIRELNGKWDTHPLGEYAVGQIMKIKSVKGSTITFEETLRIGYSSDLKPEVRPLFPVSNTGIECLKLIRVESKAMHGKTISFSEAINCWVTGVESSKGQDQHIAIKTSSHITISGCYFHDAYSYDGGGNGYGVQLMQHTSDCKVENSVFVRLRHSMMLASGANGNVIAYNYSTDPKSTTEMPRDAIGDLSLHGHYPFANLIEGNIVQNIFLDDYWGPNGPYNTFFRNRAELYGIAIEDEYNYAVKTNKQNLVGNEVTNTGVNKGNYVLKGSAHFTWGNNIRKMIEPTGTDSLDDKSYYLNGQPYFWNIKAPWPDIGIPNALGSGTNPAKKRYLAGDNITDCSKEKNQLIVKDINNRSRNKVITDSIKRGALIVFKH